MSSLNIESDYTPKDFLQKLLGKPFTPEPVIEEPVKTKAENSNSQSTIEDTLPSQKSLAISPRATNPKRIHFQSVQNIPGLQKRDDELSKYQPKASFQFKENLSKKPLRKQLPESHSTKGTFHLIPDLNIDSVNSFKSQPYVSVDILSVGKNENAIENLILQKSKLILKSLLKNKFEEGEITSILTSLENGIQNAAEFDKLVTSSNLESSRKKLGVKENEKPQCKLIVRSKSVEMSQKIGFVSSRKVKSCEKKKKQNLNKKQKKKLVLQSKQQILKAVKKMKQLVFLNEKSLKRTRRN